jgi:hypothetical protein
MIAEAAAIAGLCTFPTKYLLKYPNDNNSLLTIKGRP